jgi:hypothetical protein
MTPSEKAIAAMELIPLAHKDEVGQRVFRTSMHESLSAGFTVCAAYEASRTAAADRAPGFEPRCDRRGLLALDNI